MEPLAVKIATADSADVDELATLAAHTFPLACPPSVTADNIASFIDAHLSAPRFAEYLANPNRLILVATQGNQMVGYAMLVHGVGDDVQVQRAVGPRTAVELSKMYVLQQYHGTGVSAALMDKALDSASGAGCVWLGVNQHNRRAQRFYRKHGFTVNGARTFRLGTQIENDYVMVRELRRPAPAGPCNRAP
ncbi:N-acetyltransferase GCN5 [Mycobacterium xenopi RIVM700367]|uniref:GNAT family N-acetyltransferase n=1 Tax=Mycobacterium xenopi TaxID=1789 RepID=UPI00025ACBF8|nr:N-acetyltransferase [Mycobacterium xenopi]EID17161.1 N-acetyltransferase GCN5 [Mycobacterium xenopi RIVM700367]